MLMKGVNGLAELSLWSTFLFLVLDPSLLSVLRPQVQPRLLETTAHLSAAHTDATDTKSMGVLTGWGLVCLSANGPRLSSSG